MSHSFDQALLKNVFPKNWKNPKAAAHYDLVVIGGGPGGMTAAMTAAGKHARVALIEREHFGGECLNVGCIPSKALLRSSRLAAEMRDAAELGIVITKGFSVDFEAVMNRVRKLRSEISSQDNVEFFADAGIDVFLGTGHFTGKNTIAVGKQELQFKKAIIATGTQPITLDVPGLTEAGYLTNQTVFNLTKLPKRLAVIGAGPIGCELAQAFARFGSQVTLITRGAHLLPKDDILASQRLYAVMKKEGVHILNHAQPVRVERRGKNKVIYLDSQSDRVEVDEILIAAGRRPALEGLDLAEAGIKMDLQGMVINDYLQTSNPDVFAVDVSPKYNFTHVSQELAKLAVNNALAGEKGLRTSLIIPRCTFTDPEIAHIGLSESEAKAHKIPVRSFLVELSHVDRAILDSETIGFIKMSIKEGSDEIIGSTIMARHAGDMISEIAVAMVSNKGLRVITEAIHPFPTQGQIMRSAAEALLKLLAKSQKISKKAA